MVNSRFEGMKFKDEPVQSKNAASDEEIIKLKDSIYLINNTIDFTKAELKEKRFFLLHYDTVYINMLRVSKKSVPIRSGSFGPASNL